MSEYIVRDLLEKTMQNIKTDIEQNMTSKRRNASGKSVRSLRYTIDGDLHAQLEGDVSFTWMERGRKAGKVPQNFVSIIGQWIRDKGISLAGQSEHEAAWLIAHHIRENGTKLNGGFEDIYTSSCERRVKELYDSLDWWLDDITSRTLRK